jgi:hypothetical protein
MQDTKTGFDDHDRSLFGVLGARQDVDGHTGAR